MTSHSSASPTMIVDNAAGKNFRMQLNELCQRRGLLRAVFEHRQGENMSHSSRVVAPCETNWSAFVSTKSEAMESVAREAVTLLNPARRIASAPVADLPRPAAPVVTPAAPATAAAPSPAGSPAPRSQASDDELSQPESEGWESEDDGIPRPSAPIAAPARRARVANFRCELNEYCQRQRRDKPEYDMHEENMRFLARARGFETKWSQWYPTKAEAQEEAAIRALVSLRALTLSDAEPVAPTRAAAGAAVAVAPVAPRVIQRAIVAANNRCVVNEFCQKSRWSAPRYECREQNMRFWATPAAPAEIVVLGIEEVGPFYTKADAVEASATLIVEALFK